ncbi:hypothetical protein C7M84_002367 [Penaeus vannamei]|uniref:Uncharacterized protein n=1 Tax=Penaeus vannamei TaxID=6689 RepID=A0A3R7PPV3_PENVA|nr:hypothetical protein C7M84_002367 [Penaeus vannamei]
MMMNAGECAVGGFGLPSVGVAASSPSHAHLDYNDNITPTPMTGHLPEGGLQHYTHHGGLTAGSYPGGGALFQHYHGGGGPLRAGQGGHGAGGMMWSARSWPTRTPTCTTPTSPRCSVSTRGLAPLGSSWLLLAPLGLVLAPLGPLGSSRPRLGPLGSSRPLLALLGLLAPLLAPLGPLQDARRPLERSAGNEDSEKIAGGRERYYGCRQITAPDLLCRHSAHAGRPHSTLTPPVYLCSTHSTLTPPTLLVLHPLHSYSTRLLVLHPLHSLHSHSFPALRIYLHSTLIFSLRSQSSPPAIAPQAVLDPFRHPNFPPHDEEEARDELSAKRL